MNTTIRASLLASLTLLAGCATEGPATNGDSVRAMFAAQTAAPQPRVEQGSDARAAVSAYVNYQGTYANPTAQADGGAFGGK
ncbi:hypothetical protein [Telluria beijingensis]|uniref:hypothetical protein n=1 Tax=Telluria beijingensis TaxID=3068633 RepID=UPI002795D7EE|nr:hypothetical protein [Massilia sp. REN29]